MIMIDNSELEAEENHDSRHFENYDNVTSSLTGRTTNRFSKTLKRKLSDGDDDEYVPSYDKKIKKNRTYNDENFYNDINNIHNRNDNYFIENNNNKNDNSNNNGNNKRPEDEWPTEEVYYLQVMTLFFVFHGFKVTLL